jgi:hypothetical protein
MDDIAQQGVCQTRSKRGTPARLIMRCFQAEAPLATRGLRDAPPSNFTQDDRDRSWRAPNVAPDRGAAGGQPAALPNAGREVSNGNRKAPPLLTGLLSLDRNGCSASRVARRLLAGRAHIHVDFHSDRHFDDFRCFPGHFGSPLMPDELTLAIKGGPNRLPVKSFVIKRGTFTSASRAADPAIAHSCCFWASCRGLDRHCRLSRRRLTCHSRSDRPNWRLPFRQALRGGLQYWQPGRRS